MVLCKGLSEGSSKPARRIGGISVLRHPTSGLHNHDPAPARFKGPQRFRIAICENHIAMRCVVFKQRLHQRLTIEKRVRRESNTFVDQVYSNCDIHCFFTSTLNVYPPARPPPPDAQHSTSS